MPWWDVLGIILGIVSIIAGIAVTALYNNWGLAAVFIGFISIIGVIIDLSVNSTKEKDSETTNAPTTATTTLRADVGHLGENEPCVSDSDCADGNCGRDTADNNYKYICCPHGSKVVTTSGSHDYCNMRPNGTVCWVDRQCAGGNCKGNMWGGRGVCATK